MRNRRLNYKKQTGKWFKVAVGDRYLPNELIPEGADVETYRAKGYNRIINAFGAGTFGVLLIHANSDAMRVWLWKDTIDVVGHYTLPLGQLILFSFGVVLAIFVICNLIDQLRIATLEKWFLGWYDRKISEKADNIVNRLTSNKNG